MGERVRERERRADVSMSCWVIGMMTRGQVVRKGTAVDPPLPLSLS